MSPVCRPLDARPGDAECLARILDDRSRTGSSGLDVPAFLKWQRAQGRTPWGQTHLSHLALLDDTRLLASATRFSLAGLLDGRAVSVWALGSVMAHAPDSGDIAVRMLVQQTLADAETAGVGVALLFASRGVPWTGDLGFSDITPPESDLTFPPTRRPGAPMLSIRAGEDLDLPQLAGMTAGSHESRFRLERDMPFIRHTMAVRRLLAGLQSAGRERLEFFVTEEGMRAAAYVVMSVTERGWRLEQCGDRDPTGARVGAILQALLARDPTVTAPRVHGWLPPGFLPPQAVAAAAPASEGAVLARLVGPERATAALGSADVTYWMADRF